MTSSTAHLATAAATLGEGIQCVDEQLAWLRAERRPDGGWGDPRQPSDMLTTLAVARLFGTIDPSFDPASVVDPLRTMAAGSGVHPSLIGPEWPWLTAELVAYLRWATLPFEDRFKWPNVPDAAFDPRVGVPRYEGYLLLGDLLEKVPALGHLHVDVAFIDLANFGSWNTRHGMERGDELLALLTAHLRGLPRSRTFRDGGDEFLVVGAPDAAQLEDELRVRFASWPDVCREAFPDVDVVSLRAVISREQAAHLRAARERQGKWIGILKKDVPEPPEEGVIRHYELGPGARWRYLDPDGTWVDRDADNNV